MNNNMTSPGESVFRNWEIVMKIFSYLPWEDVCRLRNISEETRYACRSCVEEIVDPKLHGLSDSDVYDLLVAMGETGCHRLKKIDLRSSAVLSKNMGPLLKFCENIKFLGFAKGQLGHELYYYLIYNPDIEHLAIEPIAPEFFQDVCLLDVIYILPNLTNLEIPSSEITNLGLSEIAENLQTLRMLNVSNCLGISDIGLIEILEKCEQLKHLNVQNTPTMQDCIDDITTHFELRYLNALETHLTEENAIIIKNHFEKYYQPYQFFYSRAIITGRNTYDVVSIEETNPKEWKDFRLTSDSILDEILTEDFNDEDWISSSDENEVERMNITAREYLDKLQNIVDEPYDNSYDRIFKWAEKAFRPRSACFDRLTYFEREPVFLDDDINGDYSRPSSFDDDFDILWQQIRKACENVDTLKEDYDALVERFDIKTIN